MIFYTNAIWILNGAMMTIFFLFASYLSEGSSLGGVVATTAFFFNHGECTRVMNTPPLRESFAYPFCICHMFVVTMVLKRKNPSYWLSAILAITTVSFMLPWQFAQFALLTQLLAVFGVHAIQYTNRNNTVKYLAGIWAGFIISFAFLLGNKMLITSYFFSALISVSILIYLEKISPKFLWFPIAVLIKTLFVLLASICFKMVLSRLLNIQDDAHISDILRSKFTDYRDFHTMLYTCAAEFDFLPMKTVTDLCKTLLVPTAAICCIVVLIYHLKDEYTKWRMNDNNAERTGGEVIYNILQLCAYTLMAAIIMRLKLFFTPHLCLISGLIASPKYFSFIKKKSLYYGLIFVVLALMAYEGKKNLEVELSRTGEYSDLQTEGLFDWIEKKTKKSAVFAGPMPTMANIKLSTGRPVVNHPHYEDSALRERNKKVYSIFSRRATKTVYATLREMYVQYVVIAHHWCFGSSKSGCSMYESWDLEEPNFKNQPIVCKSLIQNGKSEYFEKVFDNQQYSVFKLKNPRLFKK
ncbi:DgyrCDS12217 [Dimorphilus gyrociliatus]|uniref:DgyrCDS12217 n=1 Tax=Dimorphilus gyrociliatus TaxID=2664684 RepID=A0A7I8W7X5_9ANNE|nr:DgyrCDS12217 [Dimorphilus gyrociliatus]